MKRAMCGLIIGTALISGVAAAATPTSEHITLCTSLGAYGQAVMTLRQQGADPAQVVAVLDQHSEGSVQRFGRRLVALAYQQPRHAEAHHAAAVADFADRVYGTCIQRIVTQDMETWNTQAGADYMLESLMPG